MEGDIAKLDEIAQSPAVNLGPPATLDSVLEVLRELFAAAAPWGGATIDDDADLLAAGLDSLALLAFSRSVEKRLNIASFLSKVGGLVGKTAAGVRLSLRELAAWALAGGAESAEPGVQVPEAAPEPSAQYQRSAPAAFGSLDVQARLWRFPSGLELEVAEVGAGTPLLLLPPLGCELVVWKPLIEALAGKHRILAVNFPGYGSSSQLPALTLPRLASAISSICECIFPGRPPDVIGWSLGGFVAQHLATLAAARVRSLTLVNTTSCIELGTSVAQGEVLLQRLREDLSRDLKRTPEQQAAEIERLVYFGGSSRGYALFSQYALLAALFDFRSRASLICVPTLIVAGADDLPTPPTFSAKMHSAINGSTLTVLSDVGHYIPLFRPSELAHLVTQHIDRLS